MALSYECLKEFRSSVIDAMDLRPGLDFLTHIQEDLGVGAASRFVALTLFTSLCASRDKRLRLFTAKQIPALRQ